MNRDVARVETAPIAWSEEVVDPDNPGWIPQNPAEEAESRAALEAMEQVQAQQKMRELAQAALTGNEVLDRETNNQVRYAMHFVRTEIAWGQQLDQQIAHLHHAIHKPEAQKEKMERKGKWYGQNSPRQIRIREDIHNAELQIMPLQDLRSDIEKSTREYFERQDPRTAELHKQPGFRSLLTDVREIEEKVQRRQALIDEMSNPATTSARRSDLEAHIAGWGDASLDQYREELVLALMPKHAERVEKGWQSAEDKAFTERQSQILERVDILEEQQNPNTPPDRQDEIMSIIGSWNGESIARFRSRLMGHDPVRVGRFKSWVIRKADDAYQAAENDPGSMDNKLHGQLDVEKQIDELEQSIAQPPDPADELAEKRKARDIATLKGLQSKKASWKKSTDDLKAELLAKKRSKRDRLKLAATYGD